MSSKIELKHREIPFNFKQAMESEVFTLDLLKKEYASQDCFGGPVALAPDLGRSLFFESGEQQIAYLKKGFKAYETKSSTTMVAQEVRHSLYHRSLNTKIIDNRIQKHPILGQVSETALSVWMARNGLLFEHISRNPGDPESVKNLLRRVAVFETNVGLLTGAVILDRLDKYGADAFANLAPYYYLWFYHYVEEMEHCQEAFDYYEERYQEPLWEAKYFDTTMRDLKDAVSLEVHYILATAWKLQLPITMADIMNEPIYRERAELLKKWITPGWKITDFNNYRIEKVKKWDEVYEPALRKHCEAWIAKNEGVAAKVA